MCSSGSQRETISMGSTWTSLHRSLLPYHPAPMRPTRLVFSAAKVVGKYVAAERPTNAADPLFRNCRRFMGPQLDQSEPGGKRYRSGKVSAHEEGQFRVPASIQTQSEETLGVAGGEADFVV